MCTRRVFAVAVELLTNEHGADAEWKNTFRVGYTQTPMLFFASRTYDAFTMSTTEGKLRGCQLPTKDHLF